MQVCRRRRHPRQEPHSGKEGDEVGGIFHRKKDETQGQRGEDENRPSQRTDLPRIFLLQEQGGEMEGMRLGREVLLPQVKGPNADPKE